MQRNTSDIEMQSKLFVNVIIVTHNRSDYLIRAINSVKDQSYPFYDITVVDNNSDDDTVKLVKEKFIDARIIMLDRNMGCPGARNVGIINTEGDVLFFLDDDGLLTPNVLEIIVEEMTNNSVIGAVVCAINENGKWKVWPEESESKTRIFVHDFMGQGALRRDVFIKVGLYPSNFFYGAEETDLSYRLLSNGYKIIFQPNGLTHHLRAPGGRLKHQNLLKLFNHLKVTIKYVPNPLGFIWGVKWYLMLFFASLEKFNILQFFKMTIKLIIELPSLLKYRKENKVNMDIIYYREYLRMNSTCNENYESLAKQYFHFPLAIIQHELMRHFEKHILKNLSRRIV
jgi:GT2 family glycosyltransferase